MGASGMALITFYGIEAAPGFAINNKLFLIECFKK
jgi:hypothetical protein